jgi:protein SCO1
VRPTLRVVLPAVSTVLAILLVLVVVLRGSSDRTTARNDDFDGAALPPGVRAHDFTLSDQYGRSVSLSAYRGRVAALAFLSTDCRSCVLVAQQVRGALDELGTAPISTAFVSTDPTADTPAKVNRFLSETSLTGRVQFLTGTRARLRPVWRAYRIAPASAGRSASEAATTVLLIDRNGIERVGFGLEQITPEGLAHDIRLLRAG